MLLLWVSHYQKDGFQEIGIPITMLYDGKKEGRQGARSKIEIEVKARASESSQSQIKHVYIKPSELQL